MLSAQELELLTGLVDGVLSAAARRRGELLLASNAEARDLLQQLQADAYALRALPRVAAPIDFTAKVLGTLAQDGARPARRSRPPVSPVPRAVPVWVGFAAAAAVLLLVGVGSFVLHSRRGPADDGTAALVAQLPAEPVSPPPPIRRDDGAPARAVARIEPSGPEPLHDPAMEVPPFAEDGDEDAVRPMVAPDSTPPSAGPVLGAAGSEAVGGLERVELNLPRVHSLQQLGRSEPAASLAAQLGKGSAFRIELLARDPARGLDRLRAAFVSRKVDLVVDPAAQVRLKKPGWKTDYVVFVENMTPTDVVELLRDVGRADAQAARRKSAEPRFDGAVVVKPIGRVDRRELYDLFGVDVIRSRPAAVAPKIGVDIRRPLSDHTGELVKATLEGRGVPRPGQETRQGYVAPLTGPRSRSAELKRFLDTRRPAAPGTVQVFLVLRSVS